MSFKILMKIEDSADFAILKFIREAIIQINEIMKCFNENQ